MDTERLRILVAEDDQISRTLLVELLKKRGHEVDEAVNGKIALEKFELLDNYDLLFVDLRMPELNGCMAIKKIRDEEDQKGIEDSFIIVLTAEGKDSWLRDEAARYANGVLDKPFSFERLDSLLEQAKMLRKIRKGPHPSKA